MILSTSISNQLEPTRSLAVPSPERTFEGTRMCDHTSCPLQINRLVDEIEPGNVREVVGTVFNDLLSLLESLASIESHLRHVDAAEETFALFQVIHDEACSLVEFIRAEGLNPAAMDEELIDILDGIAFAVNHDLQRVFESEQQVATSPSTPHELLSKLYRAHDVLTNCLQQSTITLAKMFDPELVGARLFNNSDMRYRQSLQLCEDLSALSQLIEACENDSDEGARLSLAAGIEKFRNESLEYLMYSDWPQFESFCERIKVAGTSAMGLGSVFHQFRCYVETLLSQVKMRAVLSNVFPIQFGGDNLSQTPEAADSSMQFFSTTCLQDENLPWDAFAVAV